jgi:hypothetical protein
LAPQLSLGLGLLHKIRLNFLEASEQFSFLQGKVFSPTPNLHPGGPGLCIYIHTKNLNVLRNLGEEICGRTEETNIGSFLLIIKLSKVLKSKGLDMTHPDTRFEVFAAVRIQVEVT